MGSWSTDFEVGLVDDFALTIKQSYFAPDARYNNGQTTLLQWHGTTDNVDLPETHIYFPLGKGWSSKDGGKTIVHDSGKSDKYFVGSSLIARLIKRCVDDFGMGDLLEARGGPFESAPWLGLVFQMKYETLDYGQGIDVKPKLFPVKFLGVDGNGVSAVVPSSPITPTSHAAVAETSLRDKVLTVIRPFKAAGDFANAQTAALNIPGVADDADLVNGLLDESGLFAEA